jgi:hypothetical protein
MRCFSLIDMLFATTFIAYTSMLTELQLRGDGV